MGQLTRREEARSWRPPARSNPAITRDSRNRKNETKRRPRRARARRWFSYARNLGRRRGKRAVNQTTRTMRKRERWTEEERSRFSSESPISPVIKRMRFARKLHISKQRDVYLRINLQLWFLLYVLRVHVVIWDNFSLTKLARMPFIFLILIYNCVRNFEFWIDRRAKIAMWFENVEKVSTLIYSRWHRLYQKRSVCYVIVCRCNLRSGTSVGSGARG